MGKQPLLGGWVFTAEMETKLISRIKKNSGKGMKRKEIPEDEREGEKGRASIKQSEGRPRGRSFQKLF